MKGLRWALIAALTTAVLLAILSPSLLNGLLPEGLLEAARMDEFPLLGFCSRVAASLVGALRGGVMPGVKIVTGALGDSFVDELLALAMVAVISMPVSLLLGFTLYRSLYSGVIRRALLYVSLNLCSVMLAWILYRQVFFRLIIEGLIVKNIPDQTMQAVARWVTQLFSAAAIGVLAVRIALAFLAVRLVMRKIIFPILGTVIRTLLFAFLTALMLLLQASPADWLIILILMAVTLVVCGLSDGMFSG